MVGNSPKIDSVAKNQGWLWWVLIVSLSLVFSVLSGLWLGTFVGTSILIGLPLFYLFLFKALTFIKRWRRALPGPEGIGLFVALIFFFSSLCTFGGSFSAYHNIYSSHFWVPFLSITLSVLLVLFLLFQAVRGEIALIFFSLFSCAIYGFGATVGLNSLLDRSIPVDYQTQIIDKFQNQTTTYNRHGNTTQDHYWIALSPAGPFKDAEQFEMSESFYESHSIGDRVTLSVRNGFFQIPWYQIDGE